MKIDEYGNKRYYNEKKINYTEKMGQQWNGQMEIKRGGMKVNKYNFLLQKNLFN